MGGSRGLGSAGTETVAERDGGMDCSAGGLGPGPHSCRFRYEATAPLFGDLCPSSHVGLSWMGDQITRLREHPEQLRPPSTIGNILRAASQTYLSGSMGAVGGSHTIQPGSYPPDPQERGHVRGWTSICHAPASPGSPFG